MSKWTENRILPLTALVIGAIGSCGEAYLLYHELADCLPYKEVHASVHGTMATTGIWLVPLMAIPLGGLFIRRNVWLPLVLPVVLSPVLFAGVYKSFSIIYGLNLVLDTNESGDFTPAKAADQFYSYCLSLETVGITIGVILATGLFYLAKPRKLA